MKTIKIEKFQVNRNYPAKSSDKLLFHLEERNGKDLKFKVVQRSNLITTATGTVRIESDKNGAHEVVRVGGADGYFDLAATDVLPIGRRLSEMPREEREKIENIIKQDVDQRKHHDLDNADDITLYDVDKEGNNQYKGKINISKS